MLSTLAYSTAYWCNSSNRSRWQVISMHVNTGDYIELDLSNKSKIINIVKKDVWGAGAGLLLAGAVGSAVIGSVASGYAALQQN